MLNPFDSNFHRLQTVIGYYCAMTVNIARSSSVSVYSSKGTMAGKDSMLLTLLEAISLLLRTVSQ